jgi:uncharacterized cysteine cluster protein YcgN (CxxCxxCC family)
MSGNRDMCDICGEIEVDLDQFPDGVCSDCAGGCSFDATDEDSVYFGGVVPEDIGFRTCNCEDYPCCGH